VISSRRGSSLPGRGAGRKVRGQPCAPPLGLAAISACREEITTAPTSSPKRCRVRAEPGMRALIELESWRHDRRQQGLREQMHACRSLIGPCEVWRASQIPDRGPNKVPSEWRGMSARETAEIQL
jgi:hypothetical protein